MLSFTLVVAPLPYQSKAEQFASGLFVGLCEGVYVGALYCLALDVGAPCHPGKDDQLVDSLCSNTDVAI